MFILKRLVDSANQVAGQREVLGATEAVETSRQAEAVGECLFEVESSEHVLDVLRVLDAPVCRMFLTVANVFGFEDDAVNNLGLEEETARYRDHHVVVAGDVEQSCFGKDADGILPEVEKMPDASGLGALLRWPDGTIDQIQFLPTDAPSGSGTDYYPFFQRDNRTWTGKLRTEPSNL